MKTNGLLKGDRQLARLPWILVALVAALATVLAYRQVIRLTAPRGTLVVARVDIPANTPLAPAHLRLAPLPRRNPPADFLPATANALGRILTVPKSAGQPILRPELKAALPPARQLAAIVPEGRVMTTLTLRNLTVPPQDLRSGDRVDVLAATATESRQRAARLVAHDAYVMGYVRTQPPAATGEKPKTMLGVDTRSKAPPSAAEGAQGLILALLPTDVPKIAEIDGSDAHISLVVHSRDSVKNGRQLVVGPASTHAIEVISGTTRGRIAIP